MRKVRGYEIRIKYSGDWFYRGYRRVWGIDDQLPVEWGQVKQESGVVHAEIYLNTECRKRADRRRILAEYSSN